MNVVDVTIILFLLMGTVIGFKRGVIKSAVSLFGTIIVFLLSFALKNPLSVLLYTYLPFFNVGIEVLNILIYEAIAFLIVFSLLSIILKVIIKVSGMIETILKFTIILGIPSKILGAIFGFMEIYVIIFAILLSFAQFNVHSSLITDSKVADKILSNTPFVSNVLDDSYKAIKEVVALNLDYSKSQDNEKLNQEGLDILLKYHVLSVDNASKLVENNKLKMNGAEEIISKYKENDAK